MKALWTAEEDSALKRLVKAGRTTLDITRVLETRSLAAVESRCKKLGLKTSRTPRPGVNTQLLNQMLKERII